MPAADLQRSRASVRSSFSRAAISAGIGGNPVRSKVTRCSSVNLSAGGAWQMPLASKLARMKESTGLRTPADSVTAGIGGSTGFLNARCCRSDSSGTGSTGVAARSEDGAVRRISGKDNWPRYPDSPSRTGGIGIIYRRLIPGWRAYNRVSERQGGSQSNGVGLPKDSAAGMISDEGRRLKPECRPPERLQQTARPEPVVVGRASSFMRGGRPRVPE